MLRFWQNPEFVRHRRSELRQTRTLAIVVLVIVVCLLVGLACWISQQDALEVARRMVIEFGGRWNERLAEMERRESVEFWRLFYRTLMLIQTGVLTFWSLLSCTQSISGERERKTWDFQRTTRLTSAELLVGKLLGEPVLAYLIALCCLPITLLTGLAGQVRLLDILSAYLLILASALFIGLIGIWLSSLLESRSRGIGLIGALGLYVFIAFAYGLQETNFPGLGAMSPVTGLLPLLGGSSAPRFVARLFGVEVSWLLMSLLLYLTCGAWLVLMIVKNIKRDYGEIRPLSRWQAVGCATFLNFMLCAVFYPGNVWAFSGGVNPLPPERIYGAHNFAGTMILINAVVLFAVGLATLSPHERLKMWWRRRFEGRATLLSEDGLPWPWLILSAVGAFGVLILGLFVWRRELPLDPGIFLNSAVQSLVVCVFVTRDVLFVQWCRLTRLRSPVIKGFLYLCLYYTASGVAAGVFGMRSAAQSRLIVNILTPAGVLDAWRYEARLSGIVLLGMVLQLVIIGFLLRAIARRLAPTPVSQSAPAT
jgi:hypothetical protein